MKKKLAVILTAALITLSPAKLAVSQDEIVNPDEPVINIETVIEEEQPEVQSSTSGDKDHPPQPWIKQ